MVNLLAAVARRPRRPCPRSIRVVGPLGLDRLHPSGPGAHPRQVSSAAHSSAERTRASHHYTIQPERCELPSMLPCRAIFMPSALIASA